MTLSANQQFLLWVIGWPLLGIIAGLFGMRFRRMRQVLVWPAAVYSAALFVYGLFRGGPNDCTETAANGTFVCHPTALFADLDAFAIGVIVIVTALSFAPMVSALTNSRTYSVVAAGFLVLLVLLFIVGLLPWIPAVAAVIGAAISGPPEIKGGAPSREPLESKP